MIRILSVFANTDKHFAVAAVVPQAPGNGGQRDAYPGIDIRFLVLPLT